METYGLTLDEYAQMLSAQGMVCAICKGSRPYNLDIDHDHAVEKALIAQGVPPVRARYLSIRGLLCKVCNRRLLSAAKDNVDILNAAIDYLDEWPSDAVLEAARNKYLDSITHG